MCLPVKFLSPLQVDEHELTRCLEEIPLKVEKLKHNQNAILASVQNQGEFREKDLVVATASFPGLHHLWF